MVMYLNPAGRTNGTARLAAQPAPSIPNPAENGRPEDPEPVRLVTRLHVASRATTARYRAVAELLDGRRRLVCVGPTAAAARAIARRSPDMPADAVGVIVQRWIGTPDAGRWEDVAVVWDYTR